MSVIGKVITRHYRTWPVRYQAFTKNSRLNYTISSRLKRISYFQHHFSNPFSLTKTQQLCTINREIEAMALSPLDPSSYSRPELAIVKHVNLKLNVDFENKQLSGIAELTINALENINELILDSSNITIESIETDDGKSLEYKLDDPVPNYGSKLTIPLAEPATVDQKIKIRIKYKTSPTATALQWLDAKQTSGKKYPYMFSQCQPIHARSILPCQDSPAVKFTYNAEVTAPEPFTVLMSAIRDDSNSSTFTFRQPVPIPSYLLAIAVGVLESRELGPRSHVWSEKEEIERSAWEFADTEKYLQAAEKLCGPYQWSQYDLLVLPPSFPYGGMENPCLTFVTPTLLAGDRSQADVIVHEIMHSWTGNLVTNRNFEHFWLNEGFTVFLERKVGASLIQDREEAKRSRDFSSLLGLQELDETVHQLGVENGLTRLVVNLTNVHPDDAFSSIPYEKGSLFLRYLEDLFGGPEVFDDFLRSYLNKFQRQSIDTDQFKAHLFEYFKDNEALKNVDWETWLHKSGMPPVIPAYDTSMTKAVTNLLAKIRDANTTFDYNDIITFTPQQIINFLQDLIDGEALPVDRLQKMGDTYKVAASKNTEITYRWLRLCIKSRDESKLNDVFQFVNNQGRMKYVRPIYRDLYAWEAMRQRAIDNFLQNEQYMMHVSAYTLKKDLHLSE
ncbi:leukotriene A-4 hydrolase isoform X2 [Zerene cesonia]|uniref:leukotriene A-4 hydrolase isoform X2 n=1 Tax=Zerene cesonia TaxID=33412 RepID=UPI0018E5139B|nr:leukotriene A-4 hydrolase isoform X2 [Zerene cesonia]